MIGHGSEGDFILVFCQMDPEEKRMSRRHSIIIVETDRTGYEAGPLHEIYERAKEVEKMIIGRNTIGKL